MPLTLDAMRRELLLLARWYNEQRPHARFRGATPEEIRTGVVPATMGPRFETRKRIAVKGALREAQGAELALEVSFLEGTRHLPCVALKRVA